MDHDHLYETDICTWAEQQAAALRSLASRAELPNELDFLNIVDEIEDIGISPCRSVSSFMRLILSHLILITVDADPQSISHWAREVATFRGELIQSWQLSMRRRIDMNQVWRHAVEEAVLKLSTYHENRTAFDADEMMARLGTASPFGIDDLCGQGFKFDGLVERLCAHLAPETSV